MAVQREWVYEEIGIDKVPNATHFAAMRAKKHCELDLGLSLRIRWVREVPAHLASLTLSMAKVLDRMEVMAGGNSFERVIRPSAFREHEPLWGQIGWVFNDGIMTIDAGQPAGEVIRSVAHEAKHLHDSQRFRTPRTAEEKAWSEERARAYADKVAAELKRGGS